MAGMVGEPPPPLARSGSSGVRLSYAQTLLSSSKQVRTPIAVKAPYFTHLGEPAAFFSKEDIHASMQMLNHAIIAKCAYGRPAIPELKSYLMQRLSLSADFVISRLNLRHVPFRLGCEGDFLKLLIQKNLYIKGFLFRFFCWSPDFDFDADPSIASVWIGFPGLPANLYHEDCMRTIAVNFGQVLRIHENTLAMTDTSEALACVELDLLAKRKERLWIDLDGAGFWQTVNYHRVPHLCSFCDKLGHLDADCNKKLGREGAIPASIGT